MKRILFVDHTPFVGGAELALAEHLRHLDRRRFTPLVACTADVPSLVDLYRDRGAEVHVTTLPRLNAARLDVVPGFLHAVLQFRRLVARERVDLVVSNSARTAYIASAALVAPRTPLVWWVRDFLYGRALFRQAKRVPRRIVCVSDAIRAFYDGVGDPRFDVVPVGSSLHERLPLVGADRVAAERTRLGLLPGDVVIGFMGRLVADKGVEDLIAAITHLRSAHPTARVVIVGTGSGQEGDVEARVRSQVAAEGKSWVVFTGYQSDEPLYYSLFDLFVHATRVDEAYPTSVIQAMMAGKPVVATATGGTPELVIDGETGLLVPPRAPEAMAAAIRRLLTDAELAARMGEAGRRRALANNTESVTTARVEAIYTQVLRSE